MATNEPELLLPHLRYVTLGDIRKELKDKFFIWIFASVITSGFVLATNHIWPSTDSDWKNPLPDWANYAIVGAAFLWLARGLRIPMLTFRGWLAVSLYISVLVFIYAHTPVWMFWFVFFGSGLLWGTLESLEARGRENFEALNPARTEARNRLSIS